MPRLTESDEIALATLIAKGYTGKEICRILNLPFKTYEARRSRLCQKHGLRGIADITRWAIRHGAVAA